ncbi:MAG TPA: DUF2889 domain-containing protein, partial [Acidimicrobiia bacterium]|nr:DUF2889 domain-containing protein [Acidimicrobiia bacterium]
PPGLYVEDDPEPLTIHDMVVDLTVEYPSYEITGFEVVFDTHPQPSCPAISAAYGQLVGLSIARGFTHQLRSLFGGPRGCAHVTALLQAMGPALIQSAWSMTVGEQRHGPAPDDGAAPAAGDPAATPLQRIGRNLNTCHVWAEEGELVQRVVAGEQIPPPLSIQKRLRELGLDPVAWRRRA